MNAKLAAHVERFRSLCEITRKHIIALNVIANEVFPSSVTYGELNTDWRHFCPLDLSGQVQIYGTQSFAALYAEEMREEILTAFPQLKVTETKDIGQNMYGFFIDFRSYTDDDIIAYMASLPKIITQVKKAPTCFML